MKRSKKRNMQPTGDKSHPPNQTQGGSQNSPADSPLISQVIPSPERGEKGCHCKPDETPMWKIWLEGIVLIIGIYALLIYRGQWTAASDANTLNSDNFKKSQRAWVGRDTSIKSPINLPDVGGTTFWLIHFKNFGPSPALHVKWRTTWFQIKRPVDWNMIQFRMDNQDMSQTTEYNIFPGEGAPNAGRFGEIMNIETRNGILNGSITSGVFGKVIYRDIFNESHKTEFCILYFPAYQGIPETWTSCPTKDIAD